MQPKSKIALDISEGLPSGSATLMNIRYGADSDWDLIAHFRYGDEAISVTVERPTAFRVTDEGNLMGYWSTIGDQGGPGGFVCELEGSAWLAEYETSTSVPDREVKHYLVAGSDDCLEVLSETEPVVHRRI